MTQKVWHRSGQCGGMCADCEFHLEAVCGLDCSGCCTEGELLG